MRTNIYSCLYLNDLFYKIIYIKSYLETIKNVRLNFKKGFTSIFCPFGNIIGNITSAGNSVFSLQCTKVSSRSNIKVFLSISFLLKSCM